MIPVISDPVELRRRGFAALVSALGWVNAVRFLRQYEKGEGDYTRERESILPSWDARTLVERIRERSGRGGPTPHGSGDAPPDG